MVEEGEKKSNEESGLTEMVEEGEKKSNEEPVTKSTNNSKEKLISEKEPLFDGEEVRVFTNLTDTNLILADLGMKGPNGGIVEPETLKPRETKDLGAIYSDEELKSSKTLRAFVFSKLIVEGRPPVEFEWPQTPALVLRERGKKQSDFQDPTTNPYDEALRKVIDKERQEDEETKMGMNLG